MAVGWVPSLMRDLTGGREQGGAAGRTVGEVIDFLRESDDLPDDFDPLIYLDKAGGE